MKPADVRIAFSVLALAFGTATLGCNSTTIFLDDFNSDAVGGPPSSSPAGDPPGDVLQIFGSPTYASWTVIDTPLSDGTPDQSLQMTKSSSGLSTDQIGINLIPSGTQTNYIQLLMFLKVPTPAVDNAHMSIDLVEGARDIIFKHIDFEPDTSGNGVLMEDDTTVIGNFPCDVDLISSLFIDFTGGGSVTMTISGGGAAVNANASHMLPPTSLVPGLGRATLSYYFGNQGTIDLDELAIYANTSA